MSTEDRSVTANCSARQAGRGAPRAIANSNRRWLLVGLCCLLLVGTMACEDEPAKSAAPAAPTAAAAQPTQDANKGARRGRGSRASDEPEVDPWKMARNWERRKVEGRDPFFGFVDKLIAERQKEEELAAQQQAVEEEVLLPAQKFDVRDFRLVGVVTNTARPKALLIDPLGQPHTVKQGDLIGNRNGVLVEIRRDEVEILQGEDIVKNPERVVMQLHPELPPGLRIELK